MYRHWSGRDAPYGTCPTLANLFSKLRHISRGELIAENPERHLQGTRLPFDHVQGRGSWELYRLDPDFYVVAADGLYDSTSRRDGAGRRLRRVSSAPCGDTRYDAARKFGGRQS